MLIPRITDGTRELLTATDDLAFNGNTSPLLHPSTDREVAFSDVGALMPAAELLLPDLSAVRALILASSLQGVIYDILYANDLCHPVTKVANPGLYVDLLSLGKKVSKARSQGKSMYESDERTGTYAVAYTVFQDLLSTLGRDGSEFILSRLKEAEPKLAPGETVLERQQVRAERADKRLFAWRYARTIAFTSAMSLLTFTSHESAAEARQINEEKVKTLEAVIDSGQATKEQINELAELNAEGRSDAPLYGLLAAGGLGRFFLWRSHPRRPRSQSL